MNTDGEFLQRIRQGRLLFDGGMGSMLIARGLEPGTAPEGWNLSRPGDVREIHTAYFDAGAEVVTANTFGATPSRLDGYGFADTGRINNSAITLAREAARDCAGGFRRFVALSVGPTGMMLPPVGTATQEEIESEFDGQLGSIEEPVDLVLGETFFDVREALAALGAAHRALRATRSERTTPVGIGLTFNKTPRGFFTVMGDAARNAIGKLERAGADFIAVNCSITSPVMVELAADLRSWTRLPVLMQPNAGDPALVDGRPVYQQSPEAFAADAALIAAAGIEAVGGCCGTTPEFIRAARAALDANDR